MKFYTVYLKRYFQGYKLRTALLVFGVAISVMFITFIGILTDSIHATDLDKRYSEYGEFQGMIAGISSSGEQLAEKENKLNEKAYSETCGSVIAGNGVVYLGSMDNKATKLTHIALISGNWPQKGDEIAIEDTTLNSMGLTVKPGDKIILDVTFYSNEKQTTDKKEYTLVGIFKNNALHSAINYSSGLLDTNTLLTVMPSLLITQEAVNDLRNDYIVQKNLIFTLKDTKNATETMNSLSLDRKVLPNVIYIQKLDQSWTQRDQNTSAEGTILSILTMLFTLVGMINSFSITIQEREHQIGILRALGAKKSQIRFIVINEATAISLLAIPIGVLSAYGLSRVALNIVQSLCGQAQILQVNTSTLILCVVVSVISVIAAALFSASKATHVSPINAIAGGHSSVMRTPSFKTMDAGSTITLNGSVTHQMAMRNLKRQKKRSVPVAIVVVLAVITCIFSFNMNNVLTLDLNRQIDESSYAYHLKGTSGLKIGAILPESGMSADQVKNLTETSGVREIDAYKILQGAICGISSSDITGYAQYLSGFILNNNTMTEWQKEGVAKLDSSLQPVNIKVIGVNEELLKKMFQDKDCGDFNSAVLYVPTLQMNSGGTVALNGGETIKPDIGLKENDSVKMVWYKNQGSSDWDTMDLKIGGIVNSLPGNMSKESDISNNVCIFVNENYFSQLTNEALFNSVYIYANRNVSFEAFDESINSAASAGKSISVESKLDEIQDFINYSKMMATKLFSTSIIITLLALLIIFYTIFSSVLVRKQELGMLRAVGMTKKQLKQMVCAENTLICSVAAFFGTLLIFPLVTGAIKVEGFSVWSNVPWLFLALVIFTCIAVAALISLYAIRNVLKNGIIESIRQVE